MVDFTDRGEVEGWRERVRPTRQRREVAGSPLWPIGAPVWAIEAWRTLKSALLAADEDWNVWTDWCEARLEGDVANPPNEALEVARVMIPNAIWNDGPAVVNAVIRRLIAEHEKEEQVVDPATEDETNFTPIFATRSAPRVSPLLATDGRPKGLKSTRVPCASSFPRTAVRTRGEG
jgi:hypothetical protein